MARVVALIVGFLIGYAAAQQSPFGAPSPTPSSLGQQRPAGNAQAPPQGPQVQEGPVSSSPDQPKNIPSVPTQSPNGSAIPTAENVTSQPSADKFAGKNNGASVAVAYSLLLVAIMPILL